MIVCHCQNITDHQIRAAVDWMRASDPFTVITSGKIYRALGKRADCGSCMPLFLDTLRGCDKFRIASPGAETAARSFVLPEPDRRMRQHNEG